MSTNFIDDFDDGDTILAEHVLQYAEPINALESGQAWYREDIGSGDAYKVDFSTANVIEASAGYTPGLIVHFKAQTANTGAATLTVQGSDGLDPPGAEDLAAIPLVKKGGTALDTGDIVAGQIVVAVYTQDSGGTNPRFEVIAGAGAGSGGGAEDLDDLDDVTITSPTSGQVIRYNGTAFVNASLSASDIASGTVPVAQGGTGATTASAARTNLGAQAQNSALDAISGLSMAKGDILVHNGTQLTKMSPGTNGQLLSADSAQSTGLNWVTSSGGGGSPTGTANKVAYFNSSGALASTANLSFNAGNTQMGVGPDTPISTLHVSSAATGAANGTTGIVVSRGGAYLNLEAGPSGDSHVGTSTASAFSLRTNNTPRFTLNSSGKCTLLPEIVGGQQLRITDYATGAVTGYKGIELDIPGYNTLRMEVGTSNDSYVGTTASEAFHLRTSNTPRFSLNGSGKCTLFPEIVGGQQLRITDYATGAVTGYKGVELDIPGYNTVRMEVGTSNDSYVGTTASEAFHLRTSNTPRFSLNGSGKCTLFPEIVGGQQLRITGYASGAVTGYKGIELDIPYVNTLRMEVGSSNDSYVGTTASEAFSLRTSNTARFTVNGSGKCTLFPGLSEQKIGLDFASSVVNGSKGIEIVNGGHYVRMEAGNSDDSYVGTATMSDFHLRRNDANMVALRSGNMALLNNIGLRFNEATANGSNYVELKSPASLSGNVSLVLPSSTGSANQYLKTDGSGNLSWGTGPAGSGATNALAFWSSSDTVSYASGFSRSGSELVAPTLTTSLGQIFSNESYITLYGNSGGAIRADFQSSKTYINAVRNYGAGELMYWNGGEVVYQYSRGAHKEDIQPIELSMDDLMKWRPVEFKWKENFGGNQDIGFVAEEVAAVFPRAATYDQPWDYTNEKTGEYAVDEDGMPKRLKGEQVAAGVKYEKAWIPMLAAVQSFYKRYQNDAAKHQDDMAKLEKRLAALEGARN